MDLFALMVPLTFDGVKVTPWAMYGMIGVNSWDAMDNGLHMGSYPPTACVLIRWPTTAGRWIPTNPMALRSGPVCPLPSRPLIR